MGYILTNLKSLGDNLYHLLKNKLHLIEAVFWNIYYLFPSRKMTVIGVTGTDGKTTTSFLIYQLLKSANKNVSLIATTGAFIEGEKIKTGLHTTTPEPKILQRLISEAGKSGCKYLVLEATSHGLDQNRLWGIDFYISVLTNITHEHLDYHQSMEKYSLAKAKLFRNSKIAFINKKYKKFVRFIRNKNLEVHFISPLMLKKDIRDTMFKKFTQRYNQENAALAVRVAQRVGLTNEQILKAIREAKVPEGRLELIRNSKGLKIVVDFAHTPNALGKVLSFLGSEKGNGNLIVVFGSAGERDKTKRPLMGKVVSKFADKIILTAEDPRSESVKEINKQIARGINGYGGELFEIENRGEAIYFAINKLAKRGDTIAICGKGHEESMCFEGTEYEWSDKMAVKKAIRGLVPTYGKALAQ